MGREASRTGAFMVIISVLAVSGACSRKAAEPIGQAEITSGTDMAGPTTAEDKERLRRAEEAAVKDIQITTEFRRRLDADDSLSALGKKVTAITVEGKVTLRGSVANAEEAATIVDKARSLPNVIAVESFLEYAPPEL